MSQTQWVTHASSHLSLGRNADRTQESGRIQPKKSVDRVLGGKDVTMLEELQCHISCVRALSQVFYSTLEWTNVHGTGQPKCLKIKRKDHILHHSLF